MVENILVFIFSIFIIYRLIIIIYDYILINHYIKLMNNIEKNNRLVKLKFFSNKFDFILKSSKLKKHLYKTLSSLKKSPFILNKIEQIYVDNLLNKLDNAD
jgi:hypothetical protein